jgi:transposase
MMVKVLLWGYANGIRSSRKIEERLQSDIVLMWLAGLEKPDFRTICLFRRTNLARLNYLFSQVILLAKGLKLVRLGLIALDGVKVRANAGVDSFKKAEDWAEALKKARDEVSRILAEAEAADLVEDIHYGARMRGDELPKGLEQSSARLQKIEDLIKEITGNQRVSRTDPEAKFMHHQNGSIPAYNGEIAVTEDQIIVYSDVTDEPVDTNQLVPALDGIKEVCGQKPKQLVADAGFNSAKNLRELEDRKIAGYIPETGEFNLGKEIKRDSNLYSKDDFRYDDKKDCYLCPTGEELAVKRRSHTHTKYSDKWIKVYGLEDEKCLGCEQRSKCTEGKSRTITRNEFEEERLRMRQKLKNPEGQAIYKKRKSIAEPVIGQIRVVGGFIQFLLRGVIGSKD